MKLSVNDFLSTLDRLKNTDEQFRLKSAKPWYDYVPTGEVDANGEEKKKKDKQLGMNYSVVDVKNTTSFSVKIENETVPIIENNVIRKSKTQTMVTIGENYPSFHGNGLWDCELSVKAEEIKLVSSAAHSTKPLNLKVQET